MKKLILMVAAGFLLASAMAADRSAAPVFQLRLVLDTPSSETEQMTVVQENKDLPKVVHNVEKKVVLDQTALKSASVQKDSLGQPQIEIVFTPEGQKRFAEVTRENVGKRLAIVIDGQLYSAPLIRDEIAGGKAVISGSFNEAEAQKLARRIAEAVKK